MIVTCAFYDGYMVLVRFIIGKRDLDFTGIELAIT